METADWTLQLFIMILKPYKLTQAGEIFETELYTTAFLPELLGALDNVCGECAANLASGVSAPSR